MFASFLIFLPVASCLFWALVHTLLAPRAYTYWYLLALLLMAAVFLMTDSYYSDARASARTLVGCSLIAQGTAPCIIPLLKIYLRKLSVQTDLKAVELGWIALPVMLFTGAALMILVIGADRTEFFLSDFQTGKFPTLRYYQGELEAYYFAVVVFLMRGTVLIQLLAFVPWLIHLCRQKGFRLSSLRSFLRHGGEIDILQIQAYNIALLLPMILAKVLLFRWQAILHPWISIVLALILVLQISLLGYVGLFGAAGRLTHAQFRDGLRYNYGTDDAAGQIGQEMTQSPTGSGGDDTRFSPVFAGDVFTSVKRTWKEDSLMGRFEQMIFGEHQYLQPGLTVVTIAERLQSNKTYISRMVNKTYHMTFPDLLNTLRIDYAEQYLIDHPDVRQHELAAACGFPSASSFNSTFKRITGVTPRIWLADYEREQRKS